MKTHHFLSLLVAVGGPTTILAADPSQVTQLELLYHHLGTKANQIEVVRPSSENVKVLKSGDHYTVGPNVSVFLRLTDINTYYFAYKHSTLEGSIYPTSIPNPLANLLEVTYPTPAAVAGVALLASTRIDPEYQAVALDYKHLDDLVKTDGLAGLNKTIRDQVQWNATNAQINSSTVNTAKTYLTHAGLQVTADRFSIEGAFATEKAKLKPWMDAIEADYKALMTKFLALPLKPNDPNPTEDEKKLVAQAQKWLDASERGFLDFNNAFTNFETILNEPTEIVVDPFQSRKDFVLIDIYASPLAVARIQPTQVDSKPTPASYEATLDLAGAWGMDYSAGIVASSPNSKDYYLQGTGASAIVRESTRGDASFLPAVFVHYYKRPGPGGTAFGPAFGASVDGSRYFLGLTEVFGRKNRILLTEGLSMSNITELNGDVVGQAPVNGSSIQTRTVFKPGFFLGLSFSFSGF